MDCPKCGAYNASSSTHCRRCGAELHPESESDTGAGYQEWESSFTPDEEWSEWESATSTTEPDEPADPWAWSEPERDPDPWTASTDEPVLSPGGSSFQDSSPDEPATADVPNYLWPSVAATLCCCAPIGIPAIIFASRVDTYLKNGDRKGAIAASQRAKNWLIASVAVALAFWGIFLATSSF